MKEKTGKERLKDWILYQTWNGKKYIRTSDIARYGAENYSNRAMRDARTLATEGVLRRVPRDEAILMGLVIGREECYEIL